ncbi:hypothetical protein [Acinetobacter baumannii]
MAKISAYRTGEPRFGRRDPKPHDYSVKTSFLSPEELEKYRNGKKIYLLGGIQAMGAMAIGTETIALPGPTSISTGT